MKARALSVSLSTVAVLILFFGSFQLSGEGSNEFSITTDPGDQRSPAIYGDIVVWEDTRNGDTDIYGLNLSTMEEFQITTAPGSQKNPAIYGNYVVWEDYRNDTSALYGYNLVTKEEVLITNSPGSKRDPAIYGDIVVWEDGRTGNPDIFGCNLSTRQEFQITTDPDWQRGPAIYGDIVVWEDHRHVRSAIYRERPAIYGLKLSTGREFRIPRKITFSSPRDRYDPALYGNIVVWRDYYEICGSNLSTSKNFGVAAFQNGECCDSCSLWDSGRPVIYEDTVIWVDCRYGNADILGYSFSTDQEFEVTAYESCQCSPALYGTTVVWEDNRNGNWDIYGTRLIPPFTPTQFKARSSVLYFDLLFAAIFAGFAVLSMFLIGRSLWYVKKFAISETTKPSAVHSREFRRSGNYVLSLVFSIVVSAIVGISYTYMFGSLIVCFWFLLPVASGFESYWKKRIPRIRVTDEEIIVFPDRPGKPQTAAWNTVQKVHIEVWTDIPSRIELFLSNGKKVKINLSNIDREDREDFIQTLKQFVK